MDYKLSATLFGHSMDVKALAVTPDGNIVSASRDKTAKIWKPNGFNAGFTEIQTLRGHSNFVNSICVLPKTEENPSGVIVTGGNDNIICAFSPDNPQPLVIFQGHSSNVCHLAPGVNVGTFLSASWDYTCKVWSLSMPNEPVATLTGHEMAVWSCMQLSGGHIVTASADKTVKVYSSDYKTSLTLTGHKDCVRDVAALSDTEILSCANDATVRKWNVLTGECLDVWYGHPNFIYSISVLSGMVVSGGEDRVVRLWFHSKHQQLILPSQSIWAVCVLPNSDIVTGSCDGVIRVFTCCPDRQADDATLAKFSEDVSSLDVAAKQEIGGVKLSDLPGKEALFEAGKSDGQLKMIREGNGAICYSWSAATKEWTKVGDVLGAGNDNNEQGGRGAKHWFNGKEYDYVFSVDVEDGKPPLKLPYNDGEDPWKAAQEFIHRNDLSQHFLEQVANFIITNSKKPEPSPSQQASSSSLTAQYCDPFTGGARYIPAGGNPSNTTTNVTNGSARTELQAETKLFPQTVFVRFDQGNVNLMLEKLQEFNKRSDKGVASEKLKSIVDLTDLTAPPNTDALETLKLLLRWSPDILFPVLDILRLAIRNGEVNAILCNQAAGEHILSILKQHMVPDALPANQMLATRTLSNMLSHPSGQSLVLNNRQPLLYLLTELLSNSQAPSKQLQIALTTILLNLSILFVDRNDLSSQESIISLLNKILPVCSDAEAQLRGLVALGTLLASSLKLLAAVNTTTVDLLHQLVAAGSGAKSKVAVCSYQILQLIQK